VLLLIAVVLVVGLATGTIQRMNRAPSTQTTMQTNAQPTDALSSYTQVGAYSHGYQCVRTALAAFAKAHLTSSITTMAGAHRLTQKIVVACDGGARQDRVRRMAWFRMGANDAMYDLFGQPSVRVACLTHPDCAATHSTIVYFEQIQQGAQP